jgi:hypothetical protein
MPVEVVNAVQKRCQTGKMPAWMRKMKKSRDLSCNQLGEAVASMVENKRKRGRTKVAGKKGNESVLHLYGGDDGVWILASEPDTRLRGLEGERYLVDPTAHMASLPQWLKVAEGHMDHKPDLQKSIQISEAKFDVDRGLYLKVRSDDNELLSDIKSGAVLPSIEIDVNQDDVLENNLIDYYTPVGLGLMKENEPMGNSVGPEKPNDRFSVPMYAGELNMAEETEKAEETKTEEEAPVKTEVEPPAKPEVAEEPTEEPPDELTQATDKVAELEKKLEEVLVQVDSKASAEEELKKIYLGKIPESIHKDVDALDLNTLKAFAKLSDHFQTQLEDTTRLEEAPVINETDSVGSEEGIDEKGRMTDKLFYTLKIKHAKANGMKYPEEWERYIN